VQLPNSRASPASLRPPSAAALAASPSMLAVGGGDFKGGLGDQDSIAGGAAAMNFEFIDARTSAAKTCTARNGRPRRYHHLQPLRQPSLHPRRYHPRALRRHQSVRASCRYVIAGDG